MRVLAQARQQVYEDNAFVLDSCARSEKRLDAGQPFAEEFAQARVCASEVKPL